MIYTPKRSAQVRQDRDFSARTPVGALIGHASVWYRVAGAFRAGHSARKTQEGGGWGGRRRPVKEIGATDCRFAASIMRDGIRRDDRRLVMRCKTPYQPLVQGFRKRNRKEAVRCRPTSSMPPVCGAERAETAWGGALLTHSTQDASWAEHWTAAGRVGRGQPAGGDGMERAVAAAGCVRFEVHLWDLTLPEHIKAQPPPLACAAVTGLVPQACTAARPQAISAWAPFRRGGRMHLTRQPI